MLGFNDFKNKVSRTDEYRYDQNGNTNRDLNKDLNWVQYNSLNLPQKLQFVNGNKSEYLYDASGVKRQAKYSYSVAGIQMPIDDSYSENNNIGSVTTTDYCGNYIYENNSLKRILTPEGYIAADNGNRYSYFLKDHLGDTRVNISVAVGSTSCSVDQTTHYYPFGLEFYSHLGDIKSGTNPYLYNGKEMDRVNGLNMLDYGARWYDATIGRWGVVDPLVEDDYEWSPYNYVKDNPIIHFDPDGRQAEIALYYHETVIVAGAAQNANRATQYPSLPSVQDVKNVLDGIAASFKGTLIGGLLGVPIPKSFFIQKTDNTESATKEANKSNPKKEARDAGKNKRESQPESEKRTKDRGKALEKARGKDARREAHDKKDSGDPDRSKAQNREDYNPDNYKTKWTREDRGKR